MSILHIIGLVIIGIFVGLLADILVLQRVPGGAIGFCLVGLCGAFGADLLFKFLVKVNIINYWFYSRPAIVIESIIGAVLFTYIFSRIKWEG